MLQIKKDCPKLTKSWEILRTHDFKFNNYSFNNKIVVVIAFAIPCISMNTQSWYLKLKTKRENLHYYELPKQHLPIVEDVPSSFNFMAT
jgi:hypothetical protein